MIIDGKMLQGLYDPDVLRSLLVDIDSREVTLA